jgi:CRISPR/Cas system-associated exonuclease Cas4 (RecB family)
VSLPQDATDAWDIIVENQMGVFRVMVRAGTAGVGMALEAAAL